MDYLKFIEDIIEMIRKVDEQKAQQIIDIRGAASTGGELLTSVTYELLKMVRTDAIMYDLIGNKVTQLKAYCHSIGLMVNYNPL